MKIIGHRGARGLAPENTLASLHKALEHHVDMIEIDLRVTRDSVVILHHDPDLRDPNGRKHRLAHTDFKELKAHKADLATFEEVLAGFARTVPLYLDIKPNEPTAPVIKLLKTALKTDWRPADFRIESYSQQILLEIQAALPDIQVTVLERWSGVRASHRARQLGTRHIIMNQHWLWWGFIRAVSRSSYKLGAYTLNDPKKARRWEGYGLRAVVTDYPDRFEKH